MDVSMALPSPLSVVTSPLISSNHVNGSITNSDKGNHFGIKEDGEEVMMDVWLFRGGKYEATRAGVTERLVALTSIPQEFGGVAPSPVGNAKIPAWKMQSNVSQEVQQVIALTCVVDDIHIQIPKSRILCRNTVAMNNNTSDLTMLKYLNEATVCHSLTQRWFAAVQADATDDASSSNNHRGGIYTASGPVVIATNPIRPLPISIYTESDRLKYHSAAAGAIDQLPPHIYQSAEKALREVSSFGKSQTLIVTGQSGAGKTENSSRIIEYLVAVDQMKADTTDRGAPSLSSKILMGNIIVESFGNAVTPRNSNSSRFSKRTKVLYHKGTLVGAQIETFLLERSRVTHLTSKDRTFHIFYEILLAPGAADVRARWGLSGSQSDYRLTSSGYTQVGGDDGKKWVELEDAFLSIGFTRDEIIECLAPLAAILHLSNINIVGDEGSSKFSLESTESVKAACACLGVMVSAFEYAILSREMMVNSERLKLPRNVIEARSDLAALSKLIYYKTFEDLVKRLNKKMLSEGEENHSAFIAVLDIAGFEDFARNGLSQLQFNFVNESIQHLFDTLAITSELSLYHSEGYPVTSTNAFDVIDLAPTLEVLSSCDPKRPGVLSILAAKSAIATSDDSKFKVELSNHWAKQIEPQKRLMKPTSDRITVINEPNSAVAKQFTIRHYAGTVLYDIDGDWLASNRQELSLGIRTLLRDSNDRRYRDFIITHQGGLSQSEELTGQLRLLLDDTTTNTSLQFIRCLLPNADRSIDVVDEVMLLQQLRSNGILQAVAIAHAGFPSHSTIRDFADRYQPLLPKLLPSNAGITTLLCRVQTDPSRYWIGPQRVFMKGDTLNSLEGLLSVHMEERRRRDALEAEEAHRLNALQVEEERRRHAFEAEIQQRCQHEAQQQRQHVIESEEQHARLRSIEGQLRESQTGQELMQVQLDNQLRVTTDLQRKLADVQGEKDAVRAILADQQQVNVVSKMNSQSLQVQLDHQLRVTADLQGKLADVQAERDAVRASLDDQQRLIDNVQRQLIAVQGERDAVRASLDDQQRVIGNVQREGEAMRAELEQQHLIDGSHRAREGTMQVELDRQRRIITDLEGERDRSAMMSAQRDVDRLHQQSTITNLRGEQETLRNDIKQYAAKLERESSRRCLVEEDHARVVRANADRMRQLVDLVGSVTKATSKDRDDLCCLQKDMVLLVGVVKGTVSC